MMLESLDFWEQIGIFIILGCVMGGVIFLMEYADV
jgi:hypothetical protein